MLDVGTPAAEPVLPLNIFSWHLERSYCRAQLRRIASRRIGTSVHQRGRRSLLLNDLQCDSRVPRTRLTWARGSDGLSMPRLRRGMKYRTRSPSNYCPDP